MNNSRHKYSLIFLLYMTCGSLGFAQDDYNFSQFGRETGMFFTQPLRWEGSDWLKFGLIGAGTYLTMQADQSIRDYAMRDQEYSSSVPVEGGRIWGESYTTPVLAVAFELHGLLTDNTTTRKIGFEIGQSAIYAVVITQVLSKTVGRARPNQNLGSSSYRPFTFSGEDYHSLPGGHSTAAFVLSTVLAKNVSSTFFKILLYVPAVVTLASRVYQDFHWASDDLLGAAIGYVVADWVVDQHDQEESRVQLSSLYPLTIKIIIN